MTRYHQSSSSFPIRVEGFKLSDDGAKAQNRCFYSPSGALDFQIMKARRSEILRILSPPLRSNVSCGAPDIPRSPRWHLFLPNRFVAFFFLFLVVYRGEFLREAQFLSSSSNAWLSDSHIATHLTRFTLVSSTH
jgi:hypothetical protein